MHMAQAVPCIQPIILLARRRKRERCACYDKGPGQRTAPVMREAWGSPLMIDKAAAAEGQHAAVQDEAFISCIRLPENATNLPGAIWQFSRLGVD